MDQIEMLMHASLPPSPTSSPTHLRLGGTTASPGNQRMHRLGGTTTSTPIQTELRTTQQTTMVESNLGQSRSNQALLDDDAMAVKEKDDLPSTPDRNALSFSSPFSDESTPTKVLDVARKNC